MSFRVLETEQLKLRIGNTSLTCWQYLAPSYRGWSVYQGPWEAACWTPKEIHEGNFHAFFSGREEDLELFYKIIEGVKPLE